MQFNLILHEFNLPSPQKKKKKKEQRAHVLQCHKRLTCNINLSNVMSLL